MSNSTFIKKYGLCVKPTHITLYPRYKRRNSGLNNSVLNPPPIKSDAQLKAEENLKLNKTNGYLSLKATKRLRESLNWLILSSPLKRISLPKQKGYTYFKVSMLTLTLPSSQGDKSDQQIKSELLNPFLMILKSRYDFYSYVWKCEAQENGNIHFHIVTNIFMPAHEVRFLWNRLLQKKGYMDDYTKKFEKMSLGDYIKYSRKQGTESIHVIKKRFIYGKSTKWLNPNTTDIKSLRKIDNAAAYLSSYMSKKDLEKRPINGRIWSCSTNLSDKNKCTKILEDGDLDRFEHLMKSNGIEFKDIYSEPSEDGSFFWLATVYFIKPIMLLSSTLGYINQMAINFIGQINNRGPDRSFQFYG